MKIQTKQNNNKAVGAFIISAALFFLILIVIDKIGAPKFLSIIFAGIYAAVLAIVCAIKGATTNVEKFHFSHRALNANLNALSMACLVAFPFFIVGGASYYFTAPKLFVLFSAATLIGLAILTLFASRPFRQSGASTLSNFLEVRFKSRLLPVLMSIINFVGGLAIAFIALKAAVVLTSWFFLIPESIALLILVLLAAIVSCFGGLASVSRQAAIAMTCLLLAINLPLAIEAIKLTGLPFGHLSFGSAALSETVALDAQLKDAGFSALSSTISGISDLSNWSNIQLIGAALCIALGIASMPVAFGQFAAARITHRATSAGERAIVIFAFLSLSIFALAAFGKLSFYQSYFGLSVDDAIVDMPYLFEWGGRTTEIVKVCNQYNTSLDQLIASCGGDPNHVLSLADIKIDGNFILPTLASIMNYPFAVTAFIVIAILQVLLAIVSANLYSVSSNVVGAFYAQLRSASASFEIVLTRLVILCICTIGATYFSAVDLDLNKTLIAIMGLYAAALLPSLIAAFFWKNSTAFASNASIVMGAASYIGYWFFASKENAQDIIANTFNNNAIGSFLSDVLANVPPELAALFALPLSALTLVFFTVRKIRKDKKAALERKPSDEVSVIEEEDEFVDLIFEQSSTILIGKNRF